MHREVTLAPILGRTLAGIREVWSRIWFQDQPTTPLEIARIGVGLRFFSTTASHPYLFTFWGDAGWMPRTLLELMRAIRGSNRSFFYFTAPWQWVAFHAVILVLLRGPDAGVANVLGEMARADRPYLL